MVRELKMKMERAINALRNMAEDVMVYLRSNKRKKGKFLSNMA